jgi:hypothetical protein
MQDAAPPLGSLTLVEAPLIDAENLFRQPGPPLFTTFRSTVSAQSETHRANRFHSAALSSEELSKVSGLLPYNHNIVAGDVTSRGNCEMVL